MEFKYTRTYETELKISADYAVDYLPPKAEYNDPKFGFSLAYREDADKVILTKTVYLDALYITKEDFDSWNMMVDQLNEAYSEAVVLKK